MSNRRRTYKWTLCRDWRSPRRGQKSRGYLGWWKGKDKRRKGLKTRRVDGGASCAIRLERVMGRERASEDHHRKGAITPAQVSVNMWSQSLPVRPVWPFKRRQCLKIGCAQLWPVKSYFHSVKIGLSECAGWSICVSYYTTMKTVTGIFCSSKPYIRGWMPNKSFSKK